MRCMLTVNSNIVLMHDIVWLCKMQETLTVKDASDFNTEDA